jgi:hypothetical protein
MFHVNTAEKIRIYTLCSVTLFENLVIYEIIWKNIAELDRPQMTI